MTTLIEAARQALEALDAYSWEQVDSARAALRQAIEQAEKQEPVAWRWLNKETGKVGAYFEDPSNFFDLTKPSVYDWTPLYTIPQPQREWVGLTDEEMQQACYETFSYDPYVIARAIEAKLKEKNT